MNQEIRLCEVGPRDGLQMAKGMMSAADKLRWIRQLADARDPALRGAAAPATAATGGTGPLPLVWRKAAISASRLAFSAGSASACWSAAICCKTAAALPRRVLSKTL